MTEADYALIRHEEINERFHVVKERERNGNKVKIPRDDEVHVVQIATSSLPVDKRNANKDRLKRVV